MACSPIINAFGQCYRRTRWLCALALALLILSACATPAAPTVGASATTVRATAVAAPSATASAAATAPATPVVESPGLPCITSPGVATPDRYNAPMNPLPRVATGNIPGSVDVA